MSALSFTAGAFPNRNAISDTRWLPNALQVSELQRLCVASQALGWMPLCVWRYRGCL
jgi:hypothetical protein